MQCDECFCACASVFFTVIYTFIICGNLLGLVRGSATKVVACDGSPLTKEFPLIPTFPKNGNPPLQLTTFLGDDLTFQEVEWVLGRAREDSVAGLYVSRKGQPVFRMGLLKNADACSDFPCLHYDLTHKSSGLTVMFVTIAFLMGGSFVLTFFSSFADWKLCFTVWTAVTIVSGFIPSIF